MAEYGVNIAVAVKNSQAVTQLSNKIKETASRIEEVNSRFNTFANMTGKVLPGSIANFNKTLSDAAKNLSAVALNTEEAVTAAKEFVEAQREANAALRERDRLVRQVRLAGETVRQQPFGTPGFAGGPQLPKGFRARQLALEAIEEGKKAQEVFNAKRQFADELFAIEMSLSKKARDMEIDNIIKEYELENRLQDTLFKKQIDASNARAKTFMEVLASKKFVRKEDDAIARRDRRQGLLDRARAAQRFNNDLKNQQAINQIERRNIRANAALELARKKQNEDALQRIRQRPIFTGSAGQAVGSGLIGGAFPLLFGQGVGAAAGGAVGGVLGGAMGGQFGFALSLVGTQLGTVADQAVAFAAARDPLKPDFDVLKEKLGAVNNVTGELIDRYAALEEEENALALATEELTRLVGEDGVNALNQFGSDSEELASTFAQAMTVMTVGLVKFIKESGALLGISEEMKRQVLLAQASVSDNPVLRSLVEERAQFRQTAKTFAGPLPALPPFLAPLAESLNLGNPNIVRGAQAGFARVEQQIVDLQSAENERRSTELADRLSGLATPEERKTATTSAEQAARQIQQTDAFIKGLERSLALAKLLAS